jgi:hypothetical protein
MDHLEGRIEMRQFLIAFGLFFVLFAFQNCGEVDFASTPEAIAQEGLNGESGIGDGLPLPDDTDGSNGESGDNSDDSDDSDNNDDGDNSDSDQDADDSDDSDNNDDTDDSDNGDDDSSSDDDDSSSDDDDSSSDDDSSDDEVIDVPSAVDDDGNVYLSDDEIAEHACGNGNKVKIKVCHVPGGNPENAQTLCLPLEALNGHIHHERELTGEDHDVIGECEE